MKSSLRCFLFGTSLNDDKLLNFAWTLFRVHIGISIAIHAGWPKVIGSSTPDWFIRQVGDIGFTVPSPEFWALAATWGEFAGGLMLAVGFLTRFAALQLAFQFFVIAFLWYENPEPFTGMYFQQLFFWCFILAVFVGGGRYSMDRVIRRLGSGHTPIPSKVMLAAVFSFIAAAGFGQPATSRYGEKMQKETGSANINVRELRPSMGRWKGTLTYADYSNGKPVTIAANMEFSLAANGTDIVAQYLYPEEKSHDNKDIIKISEGGSVIDDARIISKTKSKSAIKVVAEKMGEDNHLAAQLRFTYHFGRHQLCILKEVRTADSQDFFFRNEYRLKR